jgi:hypothetical protein
MVHNCFVRCLTQKQIERDESHGHVADWRPGVGEESRKLRSGVTRGGLPTTASLQVLSAGPTWSPTKFRLAERARVLLILIVVGNVM